MALYVCSICGYIYDESAGDPSSDVPSGTKWEDLPESWVCPVCSAQKSAFEKKEEKKEEPAAVQAESTERKDGYTAGELSDIFSNLAKGAEKQCLPREQELLTDLAQYYLARRSKEKNPSLKALKESVTKDNEGLLKESMSLSKGVSDRGTMRVVTWATKVSAMDKSLLQQYEEKGDAMLKDTKVWVCSICGFVYVGQVPPEICPVCKVPSFKILEVKEVA